MTAFSVQTPYPPFADANGAPLENGYIWLGSAGLDPQSNPVTAYFDAALTIAAAQPIRTQGGYPVYQGTPARIYINGTNYSIRVMNKNGLTVYTALNTTEAWNGSVLADNSVTTAKLAPNAVTAAKVERVAANQVLRSTGVSTDPAWGSLNLTTDVTGVLPVANGGTGAATLTLNNVLLGNGTSAVQEVAPGASGNLLTSDGTTWESTAPPTKTLSAEVFAATTTWTAPVGVTQVKIHATGGGGGGAADAFGYAGGNGGAPGMCIAMVSVAPGTTYTVTVGAGGAGSNSGLAGAAGTETWFGVDASTKLVSCTGGGGGQLSPSGSPGANGTNGTATVTGTVLRSGAIASSGSLLNAVFGGFTIVSSNAAAQAWAVSSQYVPGALGKGEAAGASDAGGGVGGVIIIEYVG